MKKTKAIVFSVMTLLFLLYIFMQVPNLNPLFFEGAVFWSVIITAYILVWALMRYGELHFSFAQAGNGEKPFNYESKQKMPLFIKILAVVPWVYVVIMLIFSSALVSWQAYRDQLGEPEVKKFESDMQMVDVSQIPIVDSDLATKLAGKKLGEKPSLGSQVVLGEPTIQQVNNKLVWVVPLYHSGFFKWLTNMEGTPGYIVVSATNVNDVEYVDGFNIKYQPNSYLMHDLARYARFTGSIFQGITDYSFEIDDSGQPYWVVSSYSNQRGFNLPEANGVVLINASTGARESYSIENVPSWVDRVQPESFVINQIDNRGEYVNGVFNFANKDKFKSSQGHAIVYNGGRCYLFTGYTSVGSDDSAIGFMMIDMVTKQPFIYQMAGATEVAAQNSARGKVQHLGYYASFPIILNVNGLPTYFMTLKDNEGLIKQFAMVSVVNYSTVGTGETIQAAMRDYEQALKNDSSTGMIGSALEKKTITGTVDRIASETINGDLVYKLILTEQPDKIFTVSASFSDELALTREGDRVSMEYYAVETPIISANTFDNLMFSQK